ncbi:MAG: LacI family DNA-binding transcriptional regulator [Lachnospirales bacterium]
MGVRKDINLQKIASELGVSVVTVSNALNGRKGVSVKLRKDIMKKAEEIGYILPEREVKEMEIKKIGVLVADRYVAYFPSFYMDIYKNIVRVADSKHCLTVLEVVDAKKESLQEKKNSFINFNVDGIIIIGEMNQDYILWLKSVCDVPFVCMDFYNNDKNFDYFIADSFRGMCTMTEKLINLGHVDIGFLGSPKATHSIMDRYMGYLKALHKNDIKTRKDRLYSDRDKKGKICKEAIELTEDLPTAFVCNCDMAALTLIEILKDKGLRVPEDISIVSFDNYYYCKTIEGVELTTYEHNSKAMAQVGVNTLVKRMIKNKKSEGVRIVRGKVIEGNTTKKYEEMYGRES